MSFGSAFQVDNWHHGVNSVSRRNGIKTRRWGMRVTIYTGGNSGEYVLTYGQNSTDIQDNANWLKVADIGQTWGGGGGGGNTIYTGDDSLAGDRVVNGAGFGLSFQNLSSAYVQADSSVLIESYNSFDLYAGLDFSLEANNIDLYASNNSTSYADVDLYLQTGIGNIEVHSGALLSMQSQDGAELRSLTSTVDVRGETHLNLTATTGQIIEAAATYALITASTSLSPFDPRLVLDKTGDLGYPNYAELGVGTPSNPAGGVQAAYSPAFNSTASLYAYNDGVTQLATISLNADDSGGSDSYITAEANGYISMTAGTILSEDPRIILDKTGTLGAPNMVSIFTGDPNGSSGYTYFNNRFAGNAGTDYSIVSMGSTNGDQSMSASLSVNSDPAYGVGLGFVGNNTTSIVLNDTNIAITSSSDLELSLTGALTLNGDAGTATYVLTTNGPGIAPTWEPAGGGGGGFTTADNGLTASTATNVQLGGSLITPTTIEIGTQVPRFQRTGAVTSISDILSLSKNDTLTGGAGGRLRFDAYSTTRGLSPAAGIVGGNLVSGLTSTSDGLIRFGTYNTSGSFEAGLGVSGENQYWGRGGAARIGQLDTGSQNTSVVFEFGCESNTPAYTFTSRTATSIDGSSDTQTMMEIRSNIAAQTGTAEFVGLEIVTSRGARTSTGSIKQLEIRANTTQVFTIDYDGVLHLSTLSAPTAVDQFEIEIYRAINGTFDASLLGIYQSDPVVAVGTFTPTNKFKININGVEYWIQLEAV